MSNATSPLFFNRAAAALVLLGVAVLEGPELAGQSASSQVNIPDPVPVSIGGDYSITPVTNSIVPPALIFFAPDVPALGETIVRPESGQLGDPAPPPELAAYVGEFFYAPLSSLLVKKVLSDALRRRLDAYRLERDALTSELRSALNRLQEADPGSRHKALEALAVRQAGRLGALEARAEELRRSLVDAYYGYFAQRLWHLESRPGRSEDPAKIEAVMRAYAAYHNGLLPAQRGLLTEIAMEILLKGGSPSFSRKEIFFSPEMAQVKLPDPLPSALSERIATYEDKKAILKRELSEAVYVYEEANALRGNTLKADVIGQGPRLEALEKLAEEIRNGLAALPPGIRTAQTAQTNSTSAVMKARAAAIVRSRAALEAETITDIGEIHRATENRDGPVTLNYTIDETTLRFDVSYQPQRRDVGISRDTKRKMEEATLAMGRLADNFRRRSAALDHEEDALRRDIALVPTQPGEPSPDAVLFEALRDAVVNENAEAYLEYRTAVFEPGLSIEQRRLLLGHALRELKLPLPPGNLQPVKNK